MLEWVADYYELITVQKEFLGKEDWVFWRRYIKSEYRESPALREYLSEYNDWYSEKFLCLFKYMNEVDHEWRGTLEWVFLAP